MKKKRTIERVFWAGVVDDDIDINNVDTGWGGIGEKLTPMPMLFKTRADARHRYQKVVRVQIEVID